MMRSAATWRGKETNSARPPDARVVAVAHVLREIHHFFDTYKALEQAQPPVVKGFRGRVDAHAAITDAIEAYHRFKPQLLAGESPDF